MPKAELYPKQYIVDIFKKEAVTQRDERLLEAADYISTWPEDYVIWVNEPLKTTISNPANTEQFICLFSPVEKNITVH